MPLSPSTVPQALIKQPRRVASVSSEDRVLPIGKDAVEVVTIPIEQVLRSEMPLFTGAEEQVLGGLARKCVGDRDY